MASKMNRGTVLNEELDIATKITNIEERTANIEKDFEAIGEAAKDLAHAVKCYVDKVETERKSWDLIDSILECGPNAYDIFNHMKIFFNFLLSKMSSYGADITDVTMLWHLYDKEGVHEIFMKAIKSFGFKEADEDDVRLLLAIVYKQHIDTERECSTRTDAESNPIEQDKRADDVSDTGLVHDFTKLTVVEHIIKVLKSLHLNEPLRKVIKRAMAIVVYLLNVGRNAKTLSIIPSKEEESLEINEDNAGQQIVDA